MTATLPTNWFGTRLYYVSSAGENGRLAYLVIDEKEYEQNVLFDMATREFREDLLVGYPSYRGLSEAQLEEIAAKL
jgi:hypothetical protein